MDKFLSEYISDNGYSNYQVGKWHLGFCSWSHLPTRRGFERSYGSFGGGMSYHTWESGSPDYCGLEKRAFMGIDYWNLTTLGKL